MSSRIISEESWIDESIKESISMSASLPRSKGDKRSSRGKNNNSGSKAITSKISSDYIPEEDLESSIIDEVLPAV